MKKIFPHLPFALFAFVILSVSGCSVNKAKIDNDLKSFFDDKKVEGCFTMLDNATGEITVYNMGLDTMRFLPAETFDVLNGMIALHTGVLTDEKMNLNILNLDSNSASKNLNITDAFKTNSLPFFKQLAKNIGYDTLQSWVDSVSYGNKKLGEQVDQSWINNTTKISPDEQLGFMKHLYFEQLPFRKSVQTSMKELMVVNDNTDYKLSYKTGSGKNEKNENIGWMIGWIEENRHVYFFVTLLKSNKEEVNKNSVDITNSILSHYGFFKGKK
jgi:beta-lactamase class D